MISATRLTLAVLLPACTAPMPKQQPPLPADGSQDPRPRVEFRAEDHTPGYFRDVYRMLEAQVGLDPATATHRLKNELGTRVIEPGDLPEMLALDGATLEGMLMLALRGVQATSAVPVVAREIGEQTLSVSLGLDPAVAAWNRSYSPAVLETTGGAKTLATVARWMIDSAAAGSPVLCTTQMFSTSQWDPGPPEISWISEQCEPDRWVGGYCESDRWVEGDCWDEWVPENCSGGGWEDRGRYEYYCYAPNDCRYVWRSYWVYEQGYCSGGYWDEYCESGHWEDGICYDGTYVPGYCIPGHYEYRYPGGTWTYGNYYVVAPECTGVRPSQYAVATAAARVVAEKVAADMDPEWRAALEQLVASGRLDAPDEAVFDAVRQVLDATAMAAE